jgi:hypothetical protein
VSTNKKYNFIKDSDKPDNRSEAGMPNISRSSWAVVIPSAGV